MAEWSCSCGTLRIRVEPLRGMHLICYCRDCRAFPRALGHSEILDPAGGMGLFQTAPDRLTILHGADQLACLRLTERGIYRWYAACCGTPLANTLGSPRWPFAAISAAGFTDRDALGPVRARVHAQSATGELPGAAGGTARVVAAFAARIVAARISGRWKRTPFFGADGRSVLRPRPISAEERARGYGPDAKAPGG